MKTVNDFNFENKIALVRVDFNVPLGSDFEVVDTTRIEAAKPTIIKILEDGGSCVLMSHLGRPKNKEEEYSLRHIVSKASEILGVEVKFIEDCVGDFVKETIENCKPGEILLLENLRYYKEEEEGNINFAQQLSELGDIYVNDAFGTAHRAHASTCEVASFFPEKKCAGLLLTSEIENLHRVFDVNQNPVTAIIGGAKVSSKIAIIQTLLDKVDHLIIGGGMAFTFIKALGGSVGSSLVEEDKMKTALEILDIAKEKGVQVHLPVDVIAATSFLEFASIATEPIEQIPDGWMGLDVGKKSNMNFSKVISQSKTILWNGPVGVFEMKPFASGTIAIGEAIGEATKNGAFSLVGGGDSVAAVKQFNMYDKVSYVSTGGGAMLEMLEGKTLPGIGALR